VKVRVAALLIACSSHATADISIRALGSAPPPPRVIRLDPIVVADDLDDEDPLRTDCGPLLDKVTRGLRRSGALEVTPVDGRSLIGRYYLGRIRDDRGESAPLSVEFRVDCNRKSRDATAWSDNGLFHERRLGRLEASFTMPSHRTPALLPLASIQSRLDRILATSP
jgi:hypothetical protein